MCGQDGVVFAVEKLVTSKLHESSANRRIFHVDEHVGIAVAGLLADARQLVENARNEASNFRSNYGTPIPLSYLSDRVAMYMHAYTLYSSIRPFGAGLMLGSIEPNGPKLLVVDPSGVHNVRNSCSILISNQLLKFRYFYILNLKGYFGCAMGKGKQAAKTELEKIKISEMFCKDLIKEAAKV